MSGPVTVRVPASSANLGPGFDSLGLALTIYDTVTCEVLAPVHDDTGSDTAGPAIEVTGEGAGEVPTDATHLVQRCLAAGFEAMGVPLPVVRLSCANGVPHGRGLGSSSAAIVAGLWVARALVVDGAQRWSDDQLFELAATIEGHPDNVAPAVYGGLTVAYETTGGYAAARLAVSDALRLVVCVPREGMKTHVARGLLPESVSHLDAVRNAARAALLVATLSGQQRVVSGSRLAEELLAGTEDWLHQRYRAGAMPESLPLVEALRAQGLAACVSGAGPTVLVLLTADSVEEGTGAIRRATDELSGGWEVLGVDVDTDGARTIPAEPRC